VLLGALSAVEERVSCAVQQLELDERQGRLLLHVGWSLCRGQRPRRTRAGLVPAGPTVFIRRCFEDLVVAIDELQRNARPRCALSSSTITSTQVPVPSSTACGSMGRSAADTLSSDPSSSESPPGPSRSKMPMIIAQGRSSQVKPTFGAPASGGFDLEYPVVVLAVG
jgi:hypothetical protein